MADYNDMVAAAARVMDGIDAERLFVDGDEQAAKAARDKWWRRRTTHMLEVHRSQAGTQLPLKLLRTCTVVCLVNVKFDNGPGESRKPIRIIAYFGPHEQRFIAEFSQFGEILDPVESGLVSLSRPVKKTSKRAFVHEVVKPAARLTGLRTRKPLPGQLDLF